MTEPDVDASTTETVIAVSDAASTEGGPIVTSESEQVRVEDDGSVTRRLDRVEQPVGRRRPYLVPALLVILLIALGAILAAWYLTRTDTATVPAVEGLVLSDAVTRVQDEGFKTEIITQPSDAPTGTVFRQVPTPGTELDDGSTVQLYSSGGPTEVTVPNAVGVSETEARDRLAAVGLTATVVEVPSDDVAIGDVIAQSPAAGTQVAKGEAVRLNVSTGSAVTTVPNLVGTTQTDAQAQLQAAGLKANIVPVPSPEPTGTVVAQNPSSGQAPRGSAVRLNVSSGQ